LEFSLKFTEKIVWNKCGKCC